MDDINEFFAEQEQRMNLPDEDVHEYIRARLEDRRKQRFANFTMLFTRILSYLIDVFSRVIGSNFASKPAIRAQSHGPEDRCKTAASWQNSGPFRASAAESVPQEPHISGEEKVVRQCVSFDFRAVFPN